MESQIDILRRSFEGMSLREYVACCRLIRNQVDQISDVERRLRVLSALTCIELWHQGRVGLREDILGKLEFISHELKALSMES